MRSMKKVVAVALVSAMMATSVNAPVSAAKKVNVKKVTVESSISGNKKTVYVAKGKKVKLKATVKVTPNKKKNKGVKYVSKSKKIATVDKKGVITGKKAGTTKITVTSVKNKKKKATITVKVTKAPVKKVTMSKKKATIKLGDSLTLKAKVKAGKGACKNVVWKTSKKKVATVTKKGVVKAVGAGTATITAKAIDGSGKKATCKVTVQDSVNLGAMDVLNAQTITFSLDRAQQLTADQISIMTKRNAGGEYKKALKIDSLTTTDGVNYNVVVNNDTVVEEKDYVQVSVPVLSGDVKSLEKQYLQQVCAYTSDEVVTAEVGNYYRDSFSFGVDGYSEYAINGVPAGLTAEVKGNYVEIKGVPTAAGVTTAVLTAKDELGNTMTKNIIFAIGSEAAVVGAAAPVYELVSVKENDLNVEMYGRIVGGSGSYKIEIADDPQHSGAKLESSYSSGGFWLDADIKVAGDYTVKVKVTDQKDANRTCIVDCVIHVAQGVTVGGSIKDAQGNVMNDWSYTKISFANKNKADRYGYRAYYDRETGAYSAILSPGTYNMCAYRYCYADAGCAEVNLYDQDFTATRQGMDITLPLYKVAFASNDTKDTERIKGEDWYLNNARIGYGSAVYVKPGNYSFETDAFSEYGDSETKVEGDWFNGTTETTVEPCKTYKYTSSANVVNAAVAAGVAKTQVSDETETYTYKYPAAKDTTYSVTELDKSYYMYNTYAYSDNGYSRYYNAFKFIPKADGKYKVLDEDGNAYVSYVYAHIYDKNGDMVTATNGEYTLKAGETYFIGTGYNDYNYSLDVEFKVTKVEESTEATTEGTADSATTTAAAATTQATETSETSETTNN